MKKVISIMISLMGALAVLSFGCGGSQEAAQEQPVTRITNVRTYTIEPMLFEEYIQLPVTVRPYREVELGVANGGEVVAIHADKGTQVREGTVLIETDKTLAAAQLRTAQANLDYQQSEFNRSRRLLDEGSITQAAFDVVQLQVSLARSSVDQAQKQVDNSTLVAPFSGVITDRSAEIGAILSPGYPAFRLIDINRVKVLTGIPEKYISDFKVGSLVNIRFDAYPERLYNGRIDFISPEADPAVRTFRAEIVVNNSDHTLKAGIMGNARILRKTIEDAIVIPLNAVIEGQTGRVVYILRDNVAQRVTVELGGSRGEYVHVISGIEPGDRLVVAGQYEVVTGERVNVTGEITIDREEVSAR